LSESEHLGGDAQFTVNEWIWATGFVSMVHCRECNALYAEGGQPCPVCRHCLDLSPVQVLVDGKEYTLPVALQGAIPWSIAVLLDQIRAEWERPVTKGSRFSGRASPKLVIVVLFWTLFEVMMERFFESAFADLPGELGEELLQRFSSIGSRLDRLYRRRWGITFWNDLATAGFPEVAEHLKIIQERRNAFIHGNPEVIDDALVQETLKRLVDVQNGWIALFNKRCTGLQRKIPIWQADMPELIGTKK